MSDKSKFQAIQQFVQRKRYASMIRRMDSSGAHAGEPSYHYCAKCGTPTEVLNQRPAFQTYQVCSQCDALVKKEWIEEAIEFSREALA